ncbi:hypothetical protein BB560_003306 [Smittium megazygosporum]|uniref:Uncharacterized protein n=1 Tax=Smittium megazygosporum TaxID=133381 RepID=A0A2T9ZCE0_9FUNG|nr:hypothetical protein BB560_003306 [Smittium megazygosporum]
MSRKNQSFDRQIPFEILCNIFVYAQNPQLSLVSRAFFEVSINTLVRANFLSFKYGDSIFDPVRGMLNRNSRLLTEALLITIIDMQTKPIPNLEYCFYIGLERGWENLCARMLRKVVIIVETNKHKFFRIYLHGSNYHKPTHKKYPNAIRQNENIYGCNKNDVVEYINIDNTLGNYFFEPLININEGDAIYLRKAISSQQLKVVKLLLECHKYIIAIESSSESGFALGKSMDKVYTNQYSLHKKLDIDASSGEPLCLAVRNGDLPMVKLLIENGATVTKDHNRALRNSVLFGDRNLEITRFLLEAGSDVHAMNESCLLTSCYKGDYGLGNPNETNQKSGRMSETTNSNSFGSQSFSNAYPANNSSPFRGVQKMYKSRYSSSGSMYAVKDAHQLQGNSKSYLRTIDLLIGFGADVNYNNSLPLIYSVSRRHYFTCKLLLSKGANVFAQNNLAFKIAESRGWDDMIQLISKAMEDKKKEREHVTEYKNI